MEGPERPTAQSATVAELPSKSHNRAVEIDPSSLPSDSVGLTQRPRSPRPPSGQVRDAIAQCGRGSPHAPAPARQLPLRRAPPSRGCDRSAVKHRLDKAREDTLIVREQTGTADSEARRLRHRVWIPAASQSGLKRNEAIIRDIIAARRQSYGDAHHWKGTRAPCTARCHMLSTNQHKAR